MNTGNIKKTEWNNKNAASDTCSRKKEAQPLSRCTGLPPFVSFPIVLA